MLRLLSNGIYVLTSRTSDRYGVATVTWLSQASFKSPMIMRRSAPEQRLPSASSKAARRRFTSSASVNWILPACFFVILRPLTNDDRDTSIHE